MLPEVTGAYYQGKYNIEIEFNDGQRGVVDFSTYLNRGGVFERFNDIEFFKNFVVNEELGILTWADEVDIAPETLYAEATGKGYPDWMNSNEEPRERKSEKTTRVM